MTYTMATPEYIWYRLLTAIGNPYGVAGLMGNLYAESRLNYRAITGVTPYSSDEYCDAIYLRTMSKEEFIHDGVAFGLAQWRYWSRKQALYEKFEKYPDFIISLDGQIDFLLEELPKYKTVWNVLLTAKTVKEASDIVLERYEKPANVGESAKAKRLEYAEGYFKAYRGKEPPKVPPVYYETTADRVNIRSGNGKEFGVLVQVKNKGTKLKWIATASNGWIAVVIPSGKSVGWASPEFVKEVNEE